MNNKRVNRTSKRGTVFLLKLTLFGLVALLQGCVNTTTATDYDATSWTEAIVSYQLVIEGFDWGPAVTAIILDLGEMVIDSTQLNADDFVVTVETEVKKEERLVIAVASSDETGNVIANQSAYLRIELAVAPTVGSPFAQVVDGELFGHRWADLRHTINYQNIIISADQKSKIMPAIASFNLNSAFVATDGMMLQYAYYQPVADGLQPLIIWLHGLAEGSLNQTVAPEIALLGNRVTSLIAPVVQDIFGGAYVLVPQAGTRWLNSGDGTHSGGRSQYESALIELIQMFVASKPTIDPARVYVIGGSNGGFMALRILINRPDLFAAAIPICLYFNPDYLSDADLFTIKNIPIWLVHDINDPITPFYHSQSLYQRLKEMGATDVHFSATDGIFDSSGEFFNQFGNPYRYFDHWSWIPVLNNELTTAINGEEITIFAWLAQQRRSR